LTECTSGCDGLPPCIKPSLPFGMVVRRGKKVPFRSEVSSEDAVGSEKALRMLGRLEVRIPMMSISQTDLMPIRSERSDARLSQCEIVIGISQEFYLFSFS
jgi:hypothetical protein